MKKSEEKLRIHIKEYMSFVESNLRFPNTKDTFSTGVNMFRWRRNIISSSKNSTITDFDRVMKSKIDKLNFENKQYLKNQTFYDKITGKRNKDDPETLDEYLEGENRYIYFDLIVYENIMTYIHETPKILPYLRLIRYVYGGNMTWKGFYQVFNFDTLSDQVEDVMTTQLGERERDILCYRFGIGGTEQKSLESLAEIYHLTHERIRQIGLKALRKLRYPSTSLKLRKKYIEEQLSSISNPEIIAKQLPKIGHWFLIYGKRGLLSVIKREPWELEESLYDIDPDLMEHYEIRSVQTVCKHTYSIPFEAFDEMDLSVKLLRSNNMYEYTVVELDEISEQQPFEDYLKCYLGNMRNQAISRRLQNESIEKAIFNFKIAIHEILDSINIDNSYEWLHEFNNRISGLVVPRSYEEKFSAIIREYLDTKLSYSQIVCIYKPYDEYSSMVVLKAKRN